MKFNHTKIMHGAVFLVALLLSACGGGGGGATAPAPINAIAHQMGGAMQGIALNLTPSVSTLAGSGSWGGWYWRGGQIQRPSRVTSDGINLYVADLASTRSARS